MVKLYHTGKIIYRRKNNFFENNIKEMAYIYIYIYIYICLKGSLKIRCGLSTILKTSTKSVWSNIFWYAKVYIFWKFIEYTIHWDKNNFLRTNLAIQKCTFFNRELQLITVLLLIRNSHTSWSTAENSLSL